MNHYWHSQLRGNSFSVIVPNLQKLGGDTEGLWKTSANPRHSPCCYGWGTFYEHETEPGLLGMSQHTQTWFLIIVTMTLKARLIKSSYVLLWHAWCWISGGFNGFLFSRETILPSMTMCCLQHMKLVWPRLSPACPPASFLMRSPTPSMSQR